MNPQAELRISDADREQAVSTLTEHYLAGRLTKEEYDERTTAAWSARTMSQVTPLFRDLPSLQQQRAAQPPVRPQRSRGSQVRRLLLMVPTFWLVVAVVALMVVAGAPWWLWMILGWMWFSGMFAGFGARGCRQLRHRSQA